MKSPNNKYRYPLFAINVVLLLAGVFIGRAYFAQQSLETGFVELVGRVVGYSSSGVEGGAIGAGTTSIYTIRTNKGATVHLSYFSNGSLGPDDPYLTNTASKIRTGLSDGKKVRIKGFYFKETNTITLDGEGSYIDEAE